jgi:hypothetical protein
MEKEMRTLYIEDVASHGGPESCVGVPVRAQRSVDRGRVGGAIGPRNPNEFRVPTLFSVAEGHAAGGPLVVGDAPSGMVRGVADQRQLGRGGSASGGNPLMHDHEQSDSSQTGS